MLQIKNKVPGRKILQSLKKKIVNTLVKKCYISKRVSIASDERTAQLLGKNGIMRNWLWKVSLINMVSACYLL